MTSIKIKNSFPVPLSLNPFLRSLPSFVYPKNRPLLLFHERGGVQEGRGGSGVGIRLRAARNRANRMARCKKELMRARR